MQGTAYDVLGDRVASNTASMAAFLLPRVNSTARYCQDWKPLELPSESRNSAYSLGVSVASTDHCSVSVFWMCLTRATHLSAWGRSSTRSSAQACSSSWSTSLSHSSVVWCCTMNSSSSWCTGSLIGRCAESRVGRSR